MFTKPCLAIPGGICKNIILAGLNLRVKCTAGMWETAAGCGEQRQDMDP